MLVSKVHGVRGPSVCCWKWAFISIGYMSYTFDAVLTKMIGKHDFEWFWNLVLRFSKTLEPLKFHLFCRFGGVFCGRWGYGSSRPWESEKMHGTHSYNVCLHVDIYRYKMCMWKELKAWSWNASWIKNPRWCETNGCCGCHGRSWWRNCWGLGWSKTLFFCWAFGGGCCAILQVHATKVLGGALGLATVGAGLGTFCDDATVQRQFLLCSEVLWEERRPSWPHQSAVPQEVSGASKHL